MEYLISLVQNNPLLYDTSHPDYMRTKTKDQIWEEIAKELNMENGKNAKDQWTKLRDCHRDALRRQRKRKSGTSATVIKPWTYQKQMEFLIPFMANRSTLSNIPDDTEQQSSDSQEASTSGHEVTVDEVTVDEVTVDEASNNVIDIPSNPYSSSTPSTKKKKPNLIDVLQNNFKKYDERAIRRDEFRELLLKKKEGEVAEENDALHQFFNSMYNLTKAMPMRYQQQIRRKLFAAVTEAEDEISSHSSTVQPSWSSSPTSYTGSELADRYPSFTYTELE